MIVCERVTKFPTEKEARDYHGDSRGYFTHGDYISTAKTDSNYNSRGYSKPKRSAPGSKSTEVRFVDSRVDGYLITNTNGMTYAGRKGIAYEASKAVLYFDEKSALDSLRFRTDSIFTRVVPVVVENGRIKYFK